MECCRDCFAGRNSLFQLADLYLHNSGNADRSLFGKMRFVALKKFIYRFVKIRKPGFKMVFFQWRFLMQYHMRLHRIFTVSIGLEQDAVPEIYQRFHMMIQIDLSHISEQIAY